jgi:hypothetical protein
MKYEIEVCLAVYQRIDVLPHLIKQLKDQTNQDFILNIWNNSSRKLNIDNIDFPPDRITIYNSETNVGSIARFLLVPHTEGKCIIFIDDDLDLQPDFIEYMYGIWKEDPDSIQGWFTRIFKSTYWDSIPYNEADVEVDYVGTGGMVLSRDIFDNNPCLLNPPPEYVKVEDLYLSFIAYKNGIKRFAAEPHCKILVDGHDQYKSLIEYKHKALCQMRNEGWVTLRERVY